MGLLDTLNNEVWFAEALSRLDISEDPVEGIFPF